MLATLRDEHGNTTVAGLDADARWPGVSYPPDRFRSDATVLDGVDLVGSGSVSDMVWARPAATVLGIDVDGLSQALIDATLATLKITATGLPSVPPVFRPRLYARGSTAAARQ